MSLINIALAGVVTDNVQWRWRILGGHSSTPQALVLSQLGDNIPPKFAMSIWVSARLITVTTILGD